MKERPILFNGAMVRALLAGTKTQTRRVVKMKPHHQIEERDDGTPWPWMHDGERNADSWLACPYGQPGDRLWVRETFVQGWDHDPVTDRIKRFDSDGKQIPIKTWYRADETDIGWCDADGWEANTPWKHSIHMPREASRITLEVTGVRVERLQDISEADALAEGCTQNHNGHFWGGPHQTSGMKQMATALQAYQDLWESINGPGSWDANPWVWVVEFRSTRPC